MKDEEIIQKLKDKSQDYNEFNVLIDTDEAISIVKQCARQEAIGFAEWLGNNYSPTNVVYVWKKDGGGFTTKELYDQYLLHLEQLKQEKK